MDQSQSGSQGVGPISTTFALDKFSWAQDVGANKKPHWNHDSRSSELFLTFRKFHIPSHGELDVKVFMEVQAGSQLLV